MKKKIEKRKDPARIARNASAPDATSEMADLPVAIDRRAPEAAPTISPARVRTITVKPAIEPSGSRQALTGEWLFVPPANGGRNELYPPEYIDLRLADNSGVLRGRYRARYHVGNRAISPTVAFQFAGQAEPDRASLPWTGDGGASGEIELRLLADGALEVTWHARSLGTELGLISGTARLVRKAE